MIVPCGEGKTYLAAAIRRGFIEKGVPCLFYEFGALLREIAEFLQPRAFTTNYHDERSQALEETLEDRIGVRLRSRLHEMCRTVIIDGEDYRRNFDT